MDREKLVERIVGAGRMRHAETPRLIKVNLANYFAGALMLPYGDFFKEVRAHALRRGAALQHLRHHLRDGGPPPVQPRPTRSAQGLPFHFLRADIAGNISKRYSGTGLKFAAGGGSCGKWAVHLAFLNPSPAHAAVLDDAGRHDVLLLRQGAAAAHRGLDRARARRTPSAWARTRRTRSTWPTGCPPTTCARTRCPRGISCRFCERTDCNQRAAASYRFAFAFDEYTKKDCFFSPLLVHEKADKGERGGKRAKGNGADKGGRQERAGQAGPSPQQRASHEPVRHRTRPHQPTLQKQRDALATLRFTGSPTEVGQGLIQLAELHGLLEDHAASREHYEEALGLFKTARNKPGQAQALFGLGVVDAPTSRTTRAPSSAWPRPRPSSTRRRTRRARRSAGPASASPCARWAQAEGAEEKYQEALILFRQTRNTQRVARLLMDIGDIRMEARGLRARPRALPGGRCTLLEKGEERGAAGALPAAAGRVGGAAGQPRGRAAAPAPGGGAVRAACTITSSRPAPGGTWACLLPPAGPAPRRATQFEAVLPLYEEQGRADEAAKVRNVLAHFTARGV